MLRRHMAHTLVNFGDLSLLLLHASMRGAGGTLQRA
jgi:hypothetical protein